MHTSSHTDVTCLNLSSPWAVTSGLSFLSPCTRSITASVTHTSCVLKHVYCFVHNPVRIALRADHGWLISNLTFNLTLYFLNSQTLKSYTHCEANSSSSNLGRIAWYYFDRWRTSTCYTQTQSAILPSTIWICGYPYIHTRACVSLCVHVLCLEFMVQSTSTPSQGNMCIFCSLFAAHLAFFPRIGADSLHTAYTNRHCHETWREWLSASRVYMLTSMHTYMHSSMHMHVHTDTRKQVHKCTNTHTYACQWEQMQCFCVCVCARVYVHVWKRIVVVFWLLYFVWCWSSTLDGISCIWRHSEKKILNWHDWR